MRREVSSVKIIGFFKENMWSALYFLKILPDSSVPEMVNQP